MKIAVVGCGALGSYYGAMLCRAGHEVHFSCAGIMTPPVGTASGSRATEGNFRIQPECARQPEKEIGPSGLVLIGLKTTANYTLPQLLPPLAGPVHRRPHPANGLGNEQAVAAVVGPERGPWVDFALSV